LIDWKTDVLFSDRPDVLRQTIDNYYKTSNNDKAQT